jgi:peptidoglycan/xylan/chitin deacetylase (PgdA/CDA1 family)
MRDAMVKRDWSYMTHGIYPTRTMYSLSIEEERAYYADNCETLLRHTGKTLKGMFGPLQSKTERTPDLMAEAGLIYHSDWFHDDQPFPLKVKSGRMVSVPYTLELNDFPLFRANFEGEDFVQMIKDQFDVLYAEGEASGKVMCISLHPFLIGQPHRIRYLDEALSYVLSHDGVWRTTGDEIAEFYLENYYDETIRATESHRRRWAGSGDSQQPGPPS